MNFCKDIDMYISLYIDELLEDDVKEEFLKHIEDCGQCAQKLKEESFITGLCKDDEEFDLPNDFSASLHNKLLELNERENKSKKNLFIYNKKFIAGLSTAAVLAISLLAYNLLPGISTNSQKAGSFSKSASPEVASASDTSQAFAQFSGDSGNSSGSGEAGPSVESRQKVDDSLNFSQSAPLSGKASSPETDRGEKKVAPPAGTYKSRKADPGQSTVNQQNSPAEDESLEQVQQYDLMKTEDKLYFSNYAELSLKVSSAGKEFENLNKFMRELGAANQGEDTARTFAANPSAIPEYTDYSMPLGLYSSLKNQALAKYQLELIEKTGIIKNDVTSEYNILVQQKLDIEEKINLALEKGEDTAALEAEKNNLQKEMDNLSANQGMITVRVYYQLN